MAEFQLLKVLRFIACSLAFGRICRANTDPEPKLMG